VRGQGASRASRVYRTQREALVAAQRLIKVKDGGEVVVHGRDGRIKSIGAYALGEEGFDRISAVEGIFLSAEMRRAFRSLDRMRLSPEKRREWLISKYGPRNDDVRRRK
jgi:hypothetical protein